MASQTNIDMREYRLEAPRIRATFIPCGARLTSLQVPDREGTWREVVVGHADVGEYRREKSPSYFGCVVGRYANRIRDGIFTVDGETYKVTCNEHDGRNSLHGGSKGYDARDWTVVSVSETTITFSLLDSRFEGFPGHVVGKLTAVIVGKALDKATPMLLTTHTFFRLGSTLAPTVLNDTLCLPTGGRFVACDDILIPTGEIVDTRNTVNHPLNFTSPQLVRQSLKAMDLCGKGGVGIDNCFIFDELPDSNAKPKLVLSSPDTGIRMSLATNQPAIQIYNGIAFDGTIQSQLGKVDAYGAMAIEPQGWIDGINHPEWDQNQVYTSATGPLVNVAEYAFDTIA